MHPDQQLKMRMSCTSVIYWSACSLEGPIHSLHTDWICHHQCAAESGGGTRFAYQQQGARLPPRPPPCVAAIFACIACIRMQLPLHCMRQLVECWSRMQESICPACEFISSSIVSYADIANLTKAAMGILLLY
jgi:hypothetical protein